MAEDFNWQSSNWRIMLTIRDANINKLEYILKIYECAQEFIISSGNPPNGAFLSNCRAGDARH